MSTPLPYRSAHIPSPSDPPRPIIHTPVALIMVTMAIAITAVVFVIVPRVERLYMDFNVALPLTTQTVLAFSRFCSHSGGILLVWILAAIPPFIVPLFRPWPPTNGRRYSRAARLIAILCFGLLAAVIAFALYSPYVELVDKLSATKK